MKITNLPEDINTKYEVSMYIHGITLTDITNIAVRIFKKKGEDYVGYFDENQIYQIRPVETVLKEQLELKNLKYYHYVWKEFFISSLGEAIFIPNDCERNYILDRKIYAQLKKGDSAERLHKLAETTYLKNGTGYKEFDMKFHSVDRPIIIGDKKHFDYIKISVKCASSVTKDDIVANKARLDEWVLETSTSITSTGCFNRSVKSEKVGLA